MIFLKFLKLDAKLRNIFHFRIVFRKKSGQPKRIIHNYLVTLRQILTKEDEKSTLFYSYLCLDDAHRL